MDLGIAGRRAIVCASSRGLGKACAMALANEGVDVVVNGRSRADLEATAEEIRRASRVEVTPIPADVTTEAGRAALLAACPDPDILVNNNAGPEPGGFLEKSRKDWLQALDANMLSALMLIQAVLPGMRQRRFGRIVNVTSAMVTTPRPPLAISSGPRAGLTAVCKTLSIEVSADNVTINNLLPERFDTDRQVQMARRQMQAQGISYEEARANIIAKIPAGRMGRPGEFGATCAFLCSQHAGYMTGMNIHLDGGAYPGLV
jgi:3-oxoacyl-[acyl-carrier protein] reductase